MSVGAPALAGSAGTRTILTRTALLLPAIVIFALSLAWPMANIVLRSLHEKGRATLGDGLFLGHYAAIAQDDLLRQVVLHTLMLAVIATGVTMLLAFPAAYVISRLPRRLSSLMMVVILMPFWVSIIVRLFAFTTILDQQGLINTAASYFGLGPFALLYNSFATIVGMVAYLLPYLILILLSAMMSIDTSLMTAARTMGASERRVFIDIYLPQVWPAVLSGALLIFVLSLGFFLTPAILGGPHDLTIPIFIQQQVQIYQWGKASAMGVVLLAVSALGYLLALKIGGKGILIPAQHGSRGTASPDPLRVTPVTLLCWLAFAFALVILILPLLVVIPTAFSETTTIRFPPMGFTGKWFVEVLTTPQWLDAFFKSIRIGLMTAIVAMLAGLALARVGTQLRSEFWRAVIQVAAISPLIVPVILLAIGIFDVQGRLHLLGSDIGLVLAHCVLCLPLTFLVMANALAFIDVSLEQAAWTMGAGPAHAFRTIVVPNLMPAMVGGLVISFVTSWDETVLALFQTGLDKTLPVTIYSFLKSGITTAVSAVAALVTVPVLLGAIILGARAVLKARSTTMRTQS